MNVDNKKTSKYLRGLLASMLVTAPLLAILNGDPLLGEAAKIPELATSGQKSLIQENPILTRAAGFTSMTDTLPAAQGTLYGNRIYRVTYNTEINAVTAGYSGWYVAANSTVVLYIPAGKTLTIRGASGKDRTPGGAGIYVPSTSNLIITGGGRLNAIGGASGQSAVGLAGSNGYLSTSRNRYNGGTGGNGGAGAGGAGAGIGGAGGTGAVGGTGNATTEQMTELGYIRHGENGGAGGSGSAGSAMGNLYVIGTVDVQASSGAAAAAKGGGAAGKTADDSGSGWSNYYAAGGGGGGAGGGSTLKPANIGGGTGGASGGGAGGTGGAWSETKNHRYAGGTGGFGEAGQGTSAEWSGGMTAPVAMIRGRGGAAGSRGGTGSAGGYYGNRQISGRNPNGTVTTNSNIQYDLLLDHSGGTSSQSTAVATLGMAVPTVPVPTRSGYKFKGYYDKNAIQYYDGNGKAAGAGAEWNSVAPSTQLYAHWEALQHTVTFNQQGGVGGPTSTVVKMHEAYNGVNPPTRSGYTFNGYWSGTNGTGTKYYNGNGSAANSTWTYNSAITLYAFWTPNNYTVTFDHQQGTGGTEKATVTMDKVYGPIQPAKRTGYTLQGYWTRTNGTGTKVYNANGTAAQTSWKTTQDTTAFAYWKINQYTHNKPADIDKNGLVASILHEPGQNQNYGETVRSTLTLKGTALTPGIHLLNVSSKTHPDYRETIARQVLQGETVSESRSLSFNVPAKNTNDIVMTHEVLDMPEVYNQSHTYDGKKKTFKLPADLGDIKQEKITYQKENQEPTETAPKDAGSYTVTLTLAIPDGTTFNLQKTLTIEAKQLTWDTDKLAGVNKRFDDTTAAKVTGTIAVKGVVTGDEVNLSGDELSKGTFEDSGAGTNKQIAVDTAGVKLAGKDRGNYKLPQYQATTRGDILGVEPRVVQKQEHLTREYNGAADAHKDLFDFFDPKHSHVLLDGEDEANVSYTYYTNAAATKMTDASDGAAEPGRAPSQVGEYWIKATYTPARHQAQYTPVITEGVVYEIVAKPVAATPEVVELVVEEKDGWQVIEGVASHVYDNTQLKPDVKVVIPDPTGNGTVELSPEDYVVTYENNVNVGTAKAIIHLKNNYQGILVEEFVITPATYLLQDIRLEDQTVVYDRLPHGLELENIFALTDIDAKLRIAYTYEKQGAASRSRSTDKPTEPGTYRVIGRVTTTNPNFQFEGGKDHGEITAMLTIAQETRQANFDFAGGSVEGKESAAFKDLPRYSKLGEHLTLPQPTRPGYRLMGWTVGGLFYTEEALAESLINEDITYQARWEKAPAMVVFDANGGRFSSDQVKQTYHGEHEAVMSFQQIPIPVKAHHRFVGWSTEPQASQAITASEFRFDGGLAEAPTYYAVYRKGQYQVTLDYNGGRNEAGESQQKIVTTYGDTLGEITEPTPPTGDQELTFKGWQNISQASDRLLSSAELAGVAPAAEDTYLTVWSGSQFAISFTGFNKGAGTFSYQIPKLTKGAIPATPEITAAAGKTFKHWLVTASQDEAIAKNATYTAEELTDLRVKGAVNFEAVFVTNQVTATFELNGGELLSGEAIQKIDYAASPAAVKAQKAGYQLTGWLKFPENQLLTPEELSSDLVKAENTTYIAQWQEDQVTLTLNGLEGDPASYQVTVLKGGNVDLSRLRTPVLPDHTFSGWASSESQAKAGVADLRGEITVEEDTTIFAVWQRKVQRVLFQDDAGNALADEELPAGSQIKEHFEKEPEAVREHASFSGWQVNGQQQLLQWQEIRDLVITKDLTITAVFDDKRYTLTFEANGGTNPPLVVKDYGMKEIYLNMYQQPTAPKGYCFAGWFDQAIGGNQVGKITLTADRSVYAQYVPGKSQFTINYYEENLTGDGYEKVSSQKASGETEVDPEFVVMERVGFTNEEALTTYQHKGSEATKEIQPITGDGSLQVDLYYKRNTNSVTYVTEGAMNNDVPQGYQGQYKFGETVPVQADLSQEGYGFGGWHTADVTVREENFTMPAHPVTFTGKYVAGGYQVTYQMNGADSQRILDDNFYHVKDQFLVAAETPEKVGYEFLGWQYGEDIAAPGAALTMPASDITLSAKWQKRSYQAQFENPDGKAIAAIEAAYQETFTLPEKPEKATGIFLGWQKDGVNYPAGASVVMGAEDQTFTALWDDSQQFTIDYKLQGGALTEVPPSKFNKEETVKLPEAIREGHGFKGWSREQEGEKIVTEIAGGEIHEDVILYAQWEKVAPDKTTYEVTFEVGDGESYPAATYKVGKQNKLLPVGRPGYEFAGWYLDSEYRKKVTRLPETHKTDVTVYAKWKKIAAGNGNGSNEGGNKPGTGGSSESGGNKPGTGGSSESGGNKPGTGGSSGSGGNKPGTGGSSESGSNKPGTSESSESGGNKPSTSGSSESGSNKPSTSESEPGTGGSTESSEDQSTTNDSTENSSDESDTDTSSSGKQSDKETSDKDRQNPGSGDSTTEDHGWLRQVTVFVERLFGMDRVRQEQGANLATEPSVSHLEGSLPERQEQVATSESLENSEENQLTRENKQTTKKQKEKKVSGKKNSTETFDLGADKLLKPFKLQGFNWILLLWMALFTVGHYYIKRKKRGETK